MVKRTDPVIPTREDAASLRALAEAHIEYETMTKEVRRELGFGRGRLLDWYDGLESDPRVARWAGRTPQWYRRVARAYTTFGDAFEKEVIRLGLTRIVLLAKHRRARTLAKGRMQKPTRRGLSVKGSELSTRDIEDILRREETRSPSYSPAPGPLFRVPEDFIGLKRSILDRLKSLLPRRGGVPPRCAVRKFDAKVRKELSSLKELLRVVIDVLEHVEGGTLTDPLDILDHGRSSGRSQARAVQGDLRRKLGRAAAARRRKGNREVPS